MGLLSKLFGGGAEKVDFIELINNGALLIDARTEVEFSGGHIEGAINIPHNIIGQKIGAHENNLERPIVVYCQSGGRSAMAAGALKKAGYKNVADGGGIQALQNELSTQ